MPESGRGLRLGARAAQPFAQGKALLRDRAAERVWGWSHRRHCASARARANLRCVPVRHRHRSCNEIPHGNARCNPLAAPRSRRAPDHGTAAMLRRGTLCPIDVLPQHLGNCPARRPSGRSHLALRFSLLVIADPCVLRLPVFPLTIRNLIDAFVVRGRRIWKESSPRQCSKRQPGRVTRERTPSSRQTGSREDARPSRTLNGYIPAEASS